MFTAAQQLQCPSANEWIQKLWYIYTMEFYAAERKKEFIPFATVWMELESIMLSEISQAVRDKYHMISPLTGITCLLANSTLKCVRWHLNCSFDLHFPIASEVEYLFIYLLAICMSSWANSSCDKGLMSNIKNSYNSTSNKQSN